METRKLPFSVVIYIERDDCMEELLKKNFHLPPRREVQLKHAYNFTSTKMIMDKKAGRKENCMTALIRKPGAIGRKTIGK